MIIDGEIYKTTNLINNKWYIGKNETADPSYLGSGILLKAAIQKYGLANFKKEILARSDSKEELCSLEVKFIAEANAPADLMSYNLAAGGNGGNTLAGFTVEERAAFSQKNSDRWKNYTKSRRLDITAKISTSLVGRKRTKQHCANIAKSKANVSQETRDKLSKAHTGTVKWSTEQKTEMSRLRSGSGNHFYGRTHTEKAKAKISRAKKGVPNPKVRKHNKTERDSIAREKLAGSNATALSKKYNISRKTVYTYINEYVI